MRLTRIGYFADFFVYPLLLALLAWYSLDRAIVGERLTWAAAAAAGVAAWTLIEYILHRYVLHCAPALRQMHAQHHASPTELIGTPSWVSVPIFVGLVLIPLVRSTPESIACGATAGLMLGYLWYVAVHHATHHVRARPGTYLGTYLYRAKQRHAVHHHSQRPCNFGVTTSLWDRVFGTTSPHV
ncbi:MAG TPA: sterol desaturase family protein [Casimicrobiaceae bacterium]